MLTVLRLSEAVIRGGILLPTISLCFYAQYSDLMQEKLSVSRNSIAIEAFQGCVAEREDVAWIRWGMLHAIRLL